MENVKEKKNTNPNNPTTEAGDALIERIVFINRVTKVTKGGKNLKFSALVVVGDGNGKAGFAIGKALEVADAIRKGIKMARRNMLVIKKKETTIAHEVIGSYGSMRVLLKPAFAGTGVIACLPVRAICECVGISDILTKVITKSNNPINVVRATFEGLESLKD